MKTFRLFLFLSLFTSSAVVAGTIEPVTKTASCIAIFEGNNFLIRQYSALKMIDIPVEAVESKSIFNKESISKKKWSIGPMIEMKRIPTLKEIDHFEKYGSRMKVPFPSPDGTYPYLSRVLEPSNHKSKQQQVVRALTGFLSEKRRVFITNSPVFNGLFDAPDGEVFQAFLKEGIVKSTDEAVLLLSTWAEKSDAIHELRHFTDWDSGVETEIKKSVAGLKTKFPRVLNEADCDFLSLTIFEARAYGQQIKFLGRGDRIIEELRDNFTKFYDVPAQKLLKKNPKLLDAYRKLRVKFDCDKV